LQHLEFQVKRVSQLNQQVYQINLLPPVGILVDYHAGQYLELLIDGTAYPFTIANAPGQRELELHLGVSEKSEYNMQILSHLQKNNSIWSSQPKGEVWLKPQLNQLSMHDPLIFIVAGTGFAQAKAMIEEQLKHQRNDLYLYWINRDSDSFYCDLPNKWAKQGLLKYHPVTRDKLNCDYLPLHTLEDRITSEINDISRIQVVTCGSPNFVYSVLDGLESKGLKQEQMMSDVFDYAPRQDKQFRVLSLSENVV